MRELSFAETKEHEEESKVSVLDRSEHCVDVNNIDLLMINVHCACSLSYSMQAGMFLLDWFRAFFTVLRILALFAVNVHPIVS